MSNLNNYNLIQNIYDNNCIIPTEVFKLLPIFKDYASKSTSILVLGVQDIYNENPILSALVFGLLNNNNTTKKLILNDKYVCNISTILNIANDLDLGLDVKTKWCNSLELNLTQNVDLTFIDTWHVYGQLKRELAKFAPLTNNYIVMHDTVIDEVYGETIRRGLDATIQATESGFTLDEINCGVGKAIDEFLAANSHWVLDQKIIFNNGLTILRNVNTTQAHL
jgi:hypothetical protein